MTGFPRSLGEFLFLALDLRYTMFGPVSLPIRTRSFSERNDWNDVIP